MIIGALLSFCAACGGAKKNYTIPATYPTQTFEAPDEDELSGEDDFLNIEADAPEEKPEQESVKEATEKSNP